MGTTSYLSWLIALRTDAADSSETSCSPLRPPNRTPTLSFFIRHYFIAEKHSAVSTQRSANETGISALVFCFDLQFLRSLRRSRAIVLRLLVHRVLAEVLWLNADC